MSADVYLTLDAYLDVVVPQIAKVKWATTVRPEPGVNAMDLTGITEMQHLVIRSTIDWVLDNAENTVVVVPEAWKFIPQGRGTPVKLAAEAFIRQARRSRTTSGSTARTSAASTKRSCERAALDPRRAARGERDQAHARQHPRRLRRERR
jgi:hypothetical protein